MLSVFEWLVFLFKFNTNPYRVLILQVLNINPNTKQLLRSVVIPTKYVTDIAFGGSKLEILYVTSKDVGDPTDSKDAGSVFQITGLDVFGLRINYAVMNSYCTPEFFNWTIKTVILYAYIIVFGNVNYKVVRTVGVVTLFLPAVMVVV